VHFVVGSFREHFDGSHDIPTALSEPLDEASADVGVSIERELTGHLTRARWTTLAEELSLVALVLFVPGFVFLDVAFDLVLVIVVVGKRRMDLSQGQRIFLEHLFRRVALFVEVDDVEDAYSSVIDGRAASAHTRDLRDVRVHVPRR
jgi:hypothetical protein